MLDRASGELLWRSEGVGQLKFLFSFLPWVELRGVGTPKSLLGAELVTSEGEVVDVRTGEHLRWVDPDSVRGESLEEDDPAWVLYRTGSVNLLDGDLLEAVAASDGLSVSRSGGRNWSFELGTLGRYLDTNYYSWRLVQDALLIVAGDDQVLEQGEEGGLVANPCRYELLVLDLEDGEVRQRVMLTYHPGPPCRIEDVDDRVVLISQGTVSDAMTGCQSFGTQRIPGNERLAPGEPSVDHPETESGREVGADASTTGPVESAPRAKRLEPQRSRGGQPGPPQAETRGIPSDELRERDRRRGRTIAILTSSGLAAAIAWFLAQALVPAGDGRLALGIGVASGSVCSALLLMAAYNEFLAPPQAGR